MTLRMIKRKPSHTPRGCEACKEAVIYSKRIFCERLGEYVDDLVYCPYFEPKYTVDINSTR